MEFSQIFPNPEIYFYKIYLKSPHIFKKYFHNSDKSLVNVFIEIPLTRIKTDLRCHRNIIVAFQKFLPTKNLF